MREVSPGGDTEQQTPAGGGQVASCRGWKRKMRNLNTARRPQSPSVWDADCVEVPVAFWIRNKARKSSKCCQGWAPELVLAHLNYPILSVSLQTTLGFRRTNTISGKKYAFFSDVGDKKLKSLSLPSPFFPEGQRQPPKAANTWRRGESSAGWPGQDMTRGEAGGCPFC